MLAQLDEGLLANITDNIHSLAPAVDRATRALAAAGGAAPGAGAKRKLDAA